MAVNYIPQESGFEASSSNISFIEYIDDHRSDSDDGEDPMKEDPKDRNNNGNEDYKHSPHLLHWEQEGKLENPNGSRDVIGIVESTSSLDTNDYHSPTSSSTSLHSDVNSQGHALDELTTQQLASSNDESEIEPLMQTIETHACSSSSTSAHIANLNSNNNKKKFGYTKGAKTFSSSSHNDEEEKSTQNSNPLSSGKHPRHKKGRFRSIQLSSIRAWSSGNLRDKPRGWMLKRKVKYGQRLVEKDGSANVHLVGTGNIDLYSRYFQDIFTTLLDSSWTLVLAITSVVYIGHWAIFALFYWGFALYNHDYEIIMGPQDPSMNLSTTDLDRQPCVFNVYDPATAFLFSLESETTIGYGSRTITTQCPAAVACLTLQCLVSAVFDTWVIGMCFARLARPDARTITTLFSKKAVICKRNGKKCLLVRFANLRKSLLHNVSVRARLISIRAPCGKEKSAGYQKMLEQHQVTFRNGNCALLTAPVEYCHVIDKESPFYGIKLDSFESTNNDNYFELVFVITGTLESTGLTMHAQTSYLSSEISYGHRFVPIISKSHASGKYIVDFSRFHDTVSETLNIDCNKPLRRFSTTAKRDVSAPLIEETEEEVLSANDDVFSSAHEAHLAESVL